jgi:hypothetical protein
MNPTKIAITFLKEHDPVFRINWNAITAQDPVVRSNVEKSLIRRACARNQVKIGDFAGHTCPPLPNHINL